MHTLWPAFLGSAAIAFTITATFRVYYGGYLCILIGHDWDLEPPWTNMELRHDPSCQRCNHEPEDIYIREDMQRVERDHRV